ncbi:MAG: GNAT family protein [Planctomycetota bacterium]
MERRQTQETASSRGPLSPAEPIELSVALPERPSGSGLFVEPKGPAIPARPVAPPALDAEIISPDEIVTARVRIRPLHASDRSAYTEALRRSRDQLAAALPMFAPYETPEAAFDRHLAQCDEGRRTARAWRRIAEDREGRLIGGVAIRGIERGLVHRGDFVVWVDSAHTGAGFGAEVARAALRFATLPLPEGLGLDQILGMALPHNVASRRMLRAAGFEPRPSEDGALELNGRREHHIAYAFEAPVLAF